MKTINELLEHGINFTQEEKEVLINRLAIIEAIQFNLDSSDPQLIEMYKLRQVIGYF